MRNHSLLSYILKRIGLMVLTFLIIATACFVLIKLLPLPAIKEQGLTGDVKKQAQELARYECDSKLYRSHFAFPAALSRYLTDEQITAVKDGMTFGVVKVTYDSHLDMIPSLTEEEKEQIRIWLEEARELAIDAESSKKKHEVFGKYKGRINNYLAKRGYDLTAERAAWYKRIEERKQQQQQ